MTPKVSILIPVFNRASMIADCVHSALAQTYSNIEVVVSDNCSNDGTYDILKNIACSDDRLKIFRQETNVGPVLNWKACASKASGKYGKILFSDDLITSDCIAKLVPYLQPETAFVYSPVICGEIAWAGKKLYQNFDGVTHINRIGYYEIQLKSNSFCPCFSRCCIIPHG